MKELPKISIITPTFNAEADIERCLQSVVNQTWQNKEHLIIDGLSTDGTLSIVRKYAELYPHIRLISEKDEGIYDAMNKGIDLATGHWIYFLGSDDVLYTTTILNDIFNEDAIEAYDLVYGNVQWGDSDKIYDGEFSRLKLMHQNICHQSIFFNKSIFDRLGKFDLKYKTWADYLFNIKCFNTNGIKIKYINIIVAKYGTNGWSSKGGDIVFLNDRESIYKELFPSEYVLLDEKLAMNNQQLVEQDQLLHQKNLQLAEQDQQLHLKNLQLTEQDQQLHLKNLQLTEQDQQLHLKNLQQTEQDQQLHLKNLQLTEQDQQLHLKDLQLVEQDQQLHLKNLQLVEQDQQLHLKNLLLAEQNQKLHHKNIQLAEQDKQLHLNNLQLAGQDQQLREKNPQIAELDQQLHQMHLQLAERDTQLAEYKKAYERRTVAYWFNSLQYLLKRVFAR